MKRNIFFLFLFLTLPIVTKVYSQSDPCLDQFNESVHAAEEEHNEEAREMLTDGIGDIAVSWVSEGIDYVSEFAETAGEMMAGETGTWWVPLVGTGAAGGAGGYDVSDPISQAQNFEQEGREQDAEFSQELNAASQTFYNCVGAS